MKTISDRDWQLLRREYGDLAYEHPEMHAELLALIRRPRLVVDNTVVKSKAAIEGGLCRQGLLAN